MEVGVESLLWGGVSCRGGGMADALDSKSSDRKVMRVRLPPSAQNTLKLRLGK